jgi:hypothetical protein
MGGFWPRIYVVKKGHAREIYFILQTRSYLALQRPLFSLYVLLSTRQCLSSAVLAPLTASFDLVVLPIESVCVGIVQNAWLRGRLHANCSSGDAR